MPETRNEFSWQTRVYWEDTDGGGVVYHANYLRFLERARTEWLRFKGIDQRQLVEQQRIAFVVIEMQLQFVKAARLDDILTVTVLPTDRRQASFQVDQEVIGEATGHTLCRARVDIACIDSEAFRPRRIPAEIRTIIDEGIESPDKAETK